MDVNCIVDNAAALLQQIDLESAFSEMPLPSPTESVFSSSSQSVSSAMNGSRRRPLLSSAISLPESFYPPSTASSASAFFQNQQQQLFSPEPRFNSVPPRIEDIFQAASQFHHNHLQQQQQQLDGGIPVEFGARRPSVATAAGDPARRAFSIEDAQSFADTLRRSSAAMTSAVQQQQQQQGTMTQTTAGGNRKLSSASLSFDVDTGNGALQQQQQQQQLVRYKTELCRPFEEHGTCRYGSKCQFAHGRAELRTVVRHPKYKTEMCRTFHTTGYCPYGTRCHFVHETSSTAKQLQSANGDQALEDNFRHQLVIRTSSSDDEQTQQVAAAALQKDMERRRSTLMQMHMQQSKQPQTLDDVMTTSLGNSFNIQPTSVTLPIAKPSSIEVAIPDSSCWSVHERLPPPPGLTHPVDVVVADPTAVGHRSNGSSPTSEFTSGFSSGGSNGDVNSGPGSPTVGLQSFQLPTVSTSGYRAQPVHRALSASVSLPPSLSIQTAIGEDGHIESPEVKSMLAAMLADVNGAQASVQQHPAVCHRRISAAADQSGSAGHASVPWLQGEASTGQQIPRDDLESLQMVVALKPDELAQLIRLVKLCNTQPTSGSTDVAVDAAGGVFPSRQNSLVGHQSLQGPSNYIMTSGNEPGGVSWNQTPTASSSYSNQHYASTACW